MKNRSVRIDDDLKPLIEAIQREEHSIGIPELIENVLVFYYDKYVKSRFPELEGLDDE